MNDMRTAIITGISGQDGALLAHLLLNQQYNVIGTSRDSLDRKRFWRLDKLNIYDKIKLITDSTEKIIQDFHPDEVYHLAGQSSVAKSFDLPFKTIKSNGFSTLEWLEAIRKYSKSTRFYHASSSEIFGTTNNYSRDESANYHPRSPYAVSKLFSHFTTINYREAYELFASCGILFNHESFLRSEYFVTSKISKGVANIAKNKQDSIEIGNLSIKRDWGHAKDYVKGMYLILQHNKPDDFVLATGRLHTIRDFFTLAFKVANINIEWKGEGAKELGVCSKSGKMLVKVNPKFYRPADINQSLGNSLKAQNKLGWKIEHTFEDIVSEMVNYELNN
ncbi:MAG TPA: GDP-mannose 4,6-dehydratase [Victivallales bacterium]|nr:GDP-mannose 4,6-dehydratase [Victivallales bacterium]